MSKSKGNVVDPQKVIEGGENQKKEPGRGADVLRMWVASVDYSADACLGENIIQQQAEVYRKIRGTLRFLLGNLNDFNLDELIPFDQLPFLDQYALQQQAKVHNAIAEAYNEFEFYRVSQLLNNHAVTFLSNFYLDVAKDRLYIRAPDSKNRRSCQTVLYHTLRCMAAALAPIAPHTAEDLWRHIPISGHATSIFEEGWPVMPGEWEEGREGVGNFWSDMLDVRYEVNKAIEAARADKYIKAPLEARVALYVEGEGFRNRASSFLLDEASGGNGVDELRTPFLVSQAELCSSADEALAQADYTNDATVPELGRVAVGVHQARGLKCERCWNYSERVGEDSTHSTLCERCVPVVRLMEKTAAA